MIRFARFICYLGLVFWPALGFLVIVDLGWVGLAMSPAYAMFTYLAWIGLKGSRDREA